MLQIHPGYESDFDPREVVLAGGFREILSARIGPISGKNDVSTIKTTATINLLAGTWVFLSPWIYGASALPNAWNSWIAGALIAIFGAVRALRPMSTRAASVLNMVLGIWTFFSPWIYAYTGDMGRFLNSLCVGALVFILGAFGSSVGRTMMPPRTS